MSLWRILPLSILSLAVVSSVAIGQQPTSSAPLEPGDVVRLTFSREPEMSGDFTVDETGSLALPILDVRQVTTIPANQLRSQILQEYGDQFRNQAIQVAVLRRVRVLGQVNEPGLYHVDPTMTLGDAIALAGGATPQGDLDDVRILRDGREIESDLESAGLPMVALNSGDQIIVPERTWLSRNSTMFVGAAVSLITALILTAR